MDTATDKPAAASGHGAVVSGESLRPARADVLNCEIECVSAVGSVFRQMGRQLRSVLRPQVCSSTRCRRNSRWDCEGYRNPGQLHVDGFRSAAGSMGDAVSRYTRTAIEW